MAEQSHFPILIKKKEGGPPQIVNLSKQHKDMIEVYLQTGNFAAVARECKVSPAYALEFLRRPEIVAYVQERFKWAAHRADVTPEKIMYKINEVLEAGKEGEYPASYMRGLELAARILKLLQPGNVQISANFYENPYDGVSDEELDKMIEARLDATKSIKKS